MHDLDDAVSFLSAHGLRARRQQWALGDTVVATPAHGDVSQDGIEVFSHALYIVSTDGTWELVNHMSGAAETVKCESLEQACFFALKRLLKPPDIDALVECGRRLASALGVPSPTDGLLRAKIHEVLYRRHAIQAAVAGLITRAEATNLLAARLVTLICTLARVPEREPPGSDQILRAIDLAWFGDQTTGAP